VAQLGMWLLSRNVVTQKGCGGSIGMLWLRRDLVAQ
jgi:hypothetical protein